MVFVQYHILLIEDDPSFAQALIDLLQDANYGVAWVSTGEEAFRLLEKEYPHLVISDISLPDINGLQFLKYLQTHLQSVPPYLFLTAKNQELDIVLGLEYGAEDYITKPFQPQILLARIEKIIQRHFPALVEADVFQYVFKGLKLSPSKRQAFYQTQNLYLQRHEFDLLLFFIQNPTMICTRQLLLERLWEPEHDLSPRNIDNTVVALRKKLTQAGGPPDLIQTVWGIGYQLAPS